MIAPTMDLVHVSLAIFLSVKKFNFPPGLLNPNEDSHGTSLFRTPANGRKRRQAPSVNGDRSGSYSSVPFNYTAEQRELCGDNNACLFDFAATGLKDLAMNTLENGENFTKAVATLSKFSFVQ